MLVPLVRRRVTSGCKEAEELRMCTTCWIFFNNAHLAWKAISLLHHMDRMHFVEGPLIRTKRWCHPVMVFHVDSGWAGRAEGAGRDGSGKLVFLSSLSAVRRLWAGTPRGIKLGQQLASGEQTQILTGCSPAQSYQQLPLNLSANPLLLPLGCLCQSDPWASFSEEGQSRSTMALQAGHLGYRSHCEIPQGISVGQSHDQCARAPLHPLLLPADCQHGPVPSPEESGSIPEAGEHHLCLSPCLGSGSCSLWNPLEFVGILFPPFHPTQQKRSFSFPPILSLVVTALFFDINK